MTCIPRCIFLTSLQEPALSWLIQQSSLTFLVASWSMEDPLMFWWWWGICVVTVVTVCALPYFIYALSFWNIYANQQTIQIPTIPESPARLQDRNFNVVKTFFHPRILPRTFRHAFKSTIKSCLGILIFFQPFFQPFTTVVALPSTLEFVHQVLNSFIK